MAYTITEMGWKPRDFYELSSVDKALTIASIIIMLETKQKEYSKAKKGG